MSQNVVQVFIKAEIQHICNTTLNKLAVIILYLGRNGPGKHTVVPHHENEVVTAQQPKISVARKRKTVKMTKRGSKNDQKISTRERKQTDQENTRSYSSFKQTAAWFVTMEIGTNVPVCDF